jgi:hypothetical protein
MTAFETVARVETDLKSGRINTVIALDEIKAALWTYARQTADDIINGCAMVSPAECAQFGQAAKARFDRTNSPVEYLELTYWRLRWIIETKNQRQASARRDDTINEERADFLRMLAGRDPQAHETCGRCGGLGDYPQRGQTCFRCRGEGTCTVAANINGELGRADYVGRQFAAEMRRGRCGCYEGYVCDDCAQTWTGADHESTEPRKCEGPCEQRNIPADAPAHVRYCPECSETLFRVWSESVEVAEPEPFVIDDGTYTMVYGDDSYFTFRVRAVKTGKLAGKRVVEYLSGPDNSLDFQPFAFVNEHSVNVWRRFEGGHLVNRAREVERMARNDRDGMEAAGLRYAERSSRCRNCNKVLTVPASLAAGYGPDCAANLGIGYGATAPVSGQNRKRGRKAAQPATEFVSMTDEELEHAAESAEIGAGREQDAFEMPNHGAQRRAHRLADRMYGELARRQLAHA